MHNITDLLVSFSTRRSGIVFIALVLLTLATGALIPRLTIDTDPENMLPDNHPARVFHNQTKQTFAMHDAIVVGVVQEQSEEGIYSPETLAEIKQLTDVILSMDGVIRADLMSLSTVDNITQAGAGTLRFEWMMDRAPATQEEASAIKASVARLPLLFDTLVAQTGRAAAIYVPIADKNQSYRIAEDIRARIEQMESQNQWYITGLPVAEDQFGVEMFVQMGISAPLAGLTIFVLLYLFFRNFALITAPMIVAMVTVIVTMGLMIGLGYTVHIMSSMIAIFLMPIAVVDSVHILSEFSDRYKPGEQARSVISRVVKHLFTPMLFTSVTSSVGFFSLMLTPIPPVQIFGAFVGFGILFAFLVTIVFIPAYVSRISDNSLTRLQQAMHNGHESNSRVAVFARGMGKLALSWRRGWLVVFSVLFAVSVWGISHIQINDNPVRWFKQDHEIRVADSILNDNFAGTYNAYLVLQSNAAVPGVADVLNSAPTPASLGQWREAFEASAIGLQGEEALESLIIAVDDAAFATQNNDELDYFDAVIAVAEDAVSKSKTFLSPAQLNYIANLQAYLSSTGLVGKSNTLADVVKVVNRELHSGEARDYALPNSPQAVAQSLLQYQSSHRPNDLWHFVTPDYRQTLLWLQLSSGDNQDMSAVIRKVAEYMALHPLPADITHQWAGKAYLNVVWQENMVAGMLDSLLGAFVMVFIMMVLLFRSFVFGLLAMLPLSITIAFIYGLIGMVGKDYDMPIAVLSALTLGLSVDFAIHFLERAKAIYKETGDVDETLSSMFGEPASAITRNALVIALGFTPLLFAPLVPYITVGVFLASIMAVSALVTLLVLPAALSLLRRWVFPSASH
ncbi:RND family transporter [Aestuariibacter sp. A3R04]|uniref:efflux RND transporter permease subunit n=1 Tax=Aestuariibacter sp. A3R04 TaxID=2841571 RepID=UPI001C084FBB|nr:MMPL family transporter [Aestuariibacter sp. A3R04]MBU3020586.1 MMPL family transporter [Aestuariibacter sp. A3R04]